MTPLHPHELVIDLFAGGGGASQGIFEATGRHPDVAINHDADAIAVHTRNHPDTLHHCASVWRVDPRTVIPERPVGLLWASPDCRHFSRAAGGGPKSKSVRSLPGVVLTWATRRRPRVIVVENVREMLGWGPLLADGTPCPDRIGRSFNVWVGRLRGLGYRVQWRELCAADFGVPTIRTRLFIVARLDDVPIAWPQPTHARTPSLLERPWRAAAACIDWSVPTRSIFGRSRPLKPATLRRIAEGVMRYAVNAAEPYIVRIGHCSEASGQHTHTFRGQALDAPLTTVSTINDKAIVTPFVVGTDMTSTRASRVFHPDEPLRTVMTGNGFGVVAASLAQHNGGKIGRPADAPMSALTTRCTQQQLLAAHLAPITHQGARRGSSLEDPVPTLTCANRGEHALFAAMLAQHNGGNPGRPLDQPLSTMLTGGHHQQLLTAGLSHDDVAGAERVAAFLLEYYGTGTARSLQHPLGAATTRGRFALVTVAGVPRPIVDIGMRMLLPAELAAAQGFGPAYDLSDAGRLGKTAQVRLIGNSVCPGLAAAVVVAQFPGGAAARAAA